MATPISGPGSSSLVLTPSAYPAAGSASFPAPSVRAGSLSGNWTHLLVAGAMIAGGALVVTGHKKAGIVVAAAGAALGLIEEPETASGWWKNLPRYLSQAQDFLEKAEGYVEQASTQGRKLQSILRK